MRQRILTGKEKVALRRFLVEGTRGHHFDAMVNSMRKHLPNLKRDIELMEKVLERC